MSFRELQRRVNFLLRRKQFDADLSEEMRLHLDLRAAEEGDLFSARRRFGNETLLRERSREAWGWQFMETLGQDLRYAGRSLNTSRAFTVVAILSLALGIGANTAIFSILNAVMLRSLPVQSPQQLVKLQTGENSYFTNPIWEQVRDHQTAFPNMLAFGNARFDLARSGVSQFTNGLWVSGDFFRVLGVPALRGRVFDTDDDRHGGGKFGAVAVVSYGFWQTNFAGSSDVIGKTIHLDRHAFQIIGVTPRWFTGLDLDEHYGVAIPIGCEPIFHTDRSALDHRSWWWLQILGRLPPGISPQQAQARMKLIAPRVFNATIPENYDPAHKKDYRNRTFSLASASTGFSTAGRQYQTALFTLMVVVAVVLLIACSNVANLLLARATARQREISVRFAIGASRLRIVRQLLSESLLLSTVSTLIGYSFAIWGSHLLVRLLSATGHELQFDLSPDLHVLGFTAGVALLTGLLFGLMPALRATAISPSQTLKESSRNTIAGASRFSLGDALVIGQVALSLFLLVGAGLFLTTLHNVVHVDSGFDPNHLLLATVDTLTAGVPPARRAQVFNRMLEGLRQVPGVVSASSSLLTPLSGFQFDENAYPLGQTAKSPDDEDVYFNLVSPGYFKTLGTPLLMGRDFSQRDTLTSPKVIILSATTTRLFFGRVSPIGKMIGIENGDGKGKRDPYQVIGVAKDSKYSSLDQDVLKAGYLAASQVSNLQSAINFAVRSRNSADAITPAIREAIAGLQPTASVEFGSLETRVKDSVRQQKTVAYLSAFFGELALVLAIVGLYGITAYSVARRQNEIGIRVALGAQRSSVVWLVLRGVATTLGLGIIVGIVASLAATKFVSSLLFGIAPTAAGPLIAAALLLAICALLAAYIPARRAAWLDPMRALREE